jgi:hypothetical protein
MNMATYYVLQRSVSSIITWQHIGVAETPQLPISQQHLARISLSFQGNFGLVVRFADGTHGEVDVSRLIRGEHAGVFERLRDPAEFARVRVAHGAVSWPGDLDLAPDAMYDAININGRWTV